MPINYSTAVKTSRMQVVGNAIKTGSATVAASGTANSFLVVGSSAFNNAAGTGSVGAGSTGVLAVITLPASGVTVSGSGPVVLNLCSGQIQGTATAGNGTVAVNAAVTNNVGTIIVGGMTVGGVAEGTASGKDVQLGASTISNGQIVTVASAALTHN